eukprot:gene27839-34620_t
MSEDAEVDFGAPESDEVEVNSVAVETVVDVVDTVVDVKEGGVEVSNLSSEAIPGIEQYLEVALLQTTPEVALSVVLGITDRPLVVTVGGVVLQLALLLSVVVGEETEVQCEAERRQLPSMFPRRDLGLETTALLSVVVAREVQCVEGPEQPVVDRLSEGVALLLVEEGGAVLQRVTATDHPQALVAEESSPQRRGRQETLSVPLALAFPIVFGQLSPSTRSQRRLSIVFSQSLFIPFVVLVSLQSVPVESLLAVLFELEEQEPKPLTASTAAEVKKVKQRSASPSPEKDEKK